MSTALYRRYRPDTFAEVIGQEHVTAPLMQAIRSNRVNHAYLFSGPRGCGKTTSARILARILNCAKNTVETPSAVPCGECDSCSDLARGGPGSLDVVEIDAASHGGVDDARELRERATFSPTRDRFKIFILDEAHMVTPQGFNALLKIVEEPPPYLKFIFATTEPDKVIGTIRSRTHHYPFRLVPSEVLAPYLEQLATAEGVTVGGGVLPLVVRAGGGSVRDSLSVMDQLIAGSTSGEVDYELAVSLLGYTHATLLDDVVEALAVRDGASIFRVVERVIDTGHEPRRFVEDLLERLRDLIVIAVSGENATAVLRDVPADQLERMRGQANNLGAAELSRAADLVNDALTEMSGATSPRLHLELLCARLLLPGADDGVQGYAARLDRLERGLGSQPRTAANAAPAAAPQVSSAPVSTAPTSTASTNAVPPVPVAVVTPAAAATPPDVPKKPAALATPPWDVPEPESSTPAVSANEPKPQRADDAHDVPASAHSVPTSEHSVPSSASDAGASAPDAADIAPAATDYGRGAAAPDTGSTAAGSLDSEVLRRRWPEVLDTLSRLRKASWALVSQNAQVVELTETTLRLAFSSTGLATTFRNGPHSQLVQQAVHETLGFEVAVEGGLAEPAGATAPTAAPAPPAEPAAAAESATPPTPPTAPTPRAASEPAPQQSPTPVTPVAAAPSAPSVREPEPEPATAEQSPSAPTQHTPTQHTPQVAPEDVTWDVVPLGGGQLTPAPQQTASPSSPQQVSPVAPAAESTAHAVTPPAPIATTPTVASPTTATPTAPAPTANSSQGTGSAPSASAARPGSRREEVERKVAESRAALAQQQAAAPSPYDEIPPDDEEPPYDDPDSVPITESNLVGAPLVAKILGGRVIDEIIEEEQ